jgi:hypothetical protein
MRLLIALFFLASGACAQTPAETPAEARDLPDHSTPLDPDPTLPPEAGLTDAEAAAEAIVAEDGVHVVHFWAPWCHNSMNELRAGLFDLVDRHPEVSFTFVAVRNGGEDGASTLDRFGLPERVRILAQPDQDPLLFLGRPITWTPTTWVFNRNGNLAYAFNYGEVSEAMLTQAIADARADWSH